MHPLTRGNLIPHPPKRLGTKSMSVDWVCQWVHICPFSTTCSRLDCCVSPFCRKVLYKRRNEWSVLLLWNSRRGGSKTKSMSVLKKCCIVQVSKKKDGLEKGLHCGGTAEALCKNGYCTLLLTFSCWDKVLQKGSKIKQRSVTTSSVFKNTRKWYTEIKIV